MFFHSCTVCAYCHLKMDAVVAFLNIFAGDRDETELTFQALHVKINALFLKEMLQSLLSQNNDFKT